MFASYLLISNSTYFMNPTFFQLDHDPERIVDLYVDLDLLSVVVLQAQRDQVRQDLLHLSNIYPIRYIPSRGRCRSPRMPLPPRY